jgi:hypothetical protein
VLSLDTSHCICKCALQWHCNALLSSDLSSQTRLRAGRESKRLSRQVSALGLCTIHMRRAHTMWQVLYLAKELSIPC